MKNTFRLITMVSVLLLLCTLIPTALGESSDAQTVKTALFSITFPSKGCSGEILRLEEKLNGCLLLYFLQSENPKTIADFTIIARIGEALDYRDALRELSLTADQPVLDETHIGGVTFMYAKYKNRDFISRQFVGRIPESNVNLQIIFNETPDFKCDVQPILDSIVFTLPALSPVPSEPPLPEDSAHYIPQPGKTSIGGRDLQAAWLPMDFSMLVCEMPAAKIAYNGDTLYILSDWRLHAFLIKDGRLAKHPGFQDGVLKLGERYYQLSMAGDGTLYVTNATESAFFVRNGAITPFNCLGNMAVHASGEWAIGYGGSIDTKMIHIGPGGMTAENWVLVKLDKPVFRKGRFLSISSVDVYNDRIYVSGYDATRNGIMAVSAFDFDGNELFVIGSEKMSDPERLVGVADVVQTQNNIVILDRGSNLLKVLTLDGKIVGSINCDELLGTKYAALVSITPAGDGLYLAAAQVRDDRSCTEMLIFHITGF